MEGDKIEAKGEVNPQRSSLFVLYVCVYIYIKKSKLFFSCSEAEIFISQWTVVSSVKSSCA